MGDEGCGVRVEFEFEFETAGSKVRFVFHMTESPRAYTDTTFVLVHTDRSFSFAIDLSVHLRAKHSPSSTG